MTPRRPRLDPATARIRTALRDVVSGSRSTGPFVVAVSGGADSLALAAAAAFLHRRGEARFLACTVDHGLQDGSALVAATVVERLEALGLPATATVATIDEDDRAGLEAAARAGRYAALASVGEGAPVLTGHTRDDQAETVLLGLLRGSGARSLSGMAPHSTLETPAGPIEVVRPLLGITREDTLASCQAQDLDVWNDPMNTDPRFTRVRARSLLTRLTQELEQDPRTGLARTADLLRDDADHLDAEAAVAYAKTAPQDSLPLAALTGLGPAVGTRLLRRWLLARGVPGGELTADHVRGVWKAAGASGAVAQAVSLPGGGEVRRTGDQLVHRHAAALRSASVRSGDRGTS